MSGNILQDLVTKKDLEKFRSELMSDLLHLLKAQGKPNHDEWLKGSAIQQILPVSCKTLQRFRIAGTIKSKKLGGTYYYKRSDVEELFST